MDRIDTGSCRKNYLKILFPKILIHKVVSKDKNLSFNLLPPCFVVPTVIMEESDVMISYGIGYDTDAEKFYLMNYKKPVYAFDCGYKDLPISKEPLVHFESSCISTSNFAMDYNDKKDVHTFGQKLKELNLEDKKIFIKLAIAGAERNALPEIVKYADNITGITVSVIVEESIHIKEILEVLKLLDKNFIIVQRSIQKTIDPEKYLLNQEKLEYFSEKTPSVFVITFINKNLVQKSTISWNQNAILSDLLKTNDIYYIPEKIDNEVIVYEKLKKNITDKL